MADIPLLVTSQNSSSERRISPHWTLAHLKSRLEPVTGIPSFSQRLSVFIAHSETPILLTPPDGRADDDYTVGEFRNALVPFARVQVDDTRPVSSQENYVDVSGVEKFELSQEEYAKRDDTVLAWKKRNQLGRFAASSDVAKVSPRAVLTARGIQIGQRCRVAEPSERRGVVRFLGSVTELPSAGATEDDAVWVGVEFDEPVGKNDGSFKGVKYFEARRNHGSFFRPDKVEVGDFPEIDDLFAEDDEEV